MPSRLEIRVPISPTSFFFRRVHFMAASLRQWEKPSHELHVWVGGDQEPEDLYKKLPWSRNYPLHWHWTDRAAFRRESYLATCWDVITAPVTSDYLMFADADVIFVDSFPELFAELDEEPGIRGVMAHAPPFADDEVSEKWHELFGAYGLGPPTLSWQHSGWGCYMPPDRKSRYSPAYYNFGMVVGSAAPMATACDEVGRAINFLKEQTENQFQHQIAWTLAMHRHALPTRPLPVRYNFPNDPQFDGHYGEELKAIKVLHYLRTKVVHRDEDFDSLEAVRKLIARDDLQGSNEVLRRVISKLYPVVAAEEGL